MENKIKAVGYIRVSTQSQAQDGESLSTQRQQIRDFAKMKGWDLLLIYADEGQSGAKSENRARLQQMLSDAKQDIFSIIVFTKLSRFARNVRDFNNLVYELNEYNVDCFSIKENIDTSTKTGKLMLNILGAFSEMEHETIREQMAENKMIRWKEARAFIGMTPLGYEWNAVNNKLEVNESEAEIYARIVNMYVSQRQSLRDIAIQLNNEGIIVSRQNKSGKTHIRRPWSNVTISYILKNPAYYGHYIVNQYEYEAGKRGAGSSRSKIKKDIGETIEFPIPQLISKVQWDEIQKTIQFNTVKSKRSESTTEYFLRDVLVCGRCGAKVKPRNGALKKDGSRLRYYVCHWAGTSAKSLEAAGKHKCSLPFIPAKRVETNVWVDILVRFALNGKKAVKLLFDPKKYEEKIGQGTINVKQLEIELSKKQRARNTLFSLSERDDLGMFEKDEFIQRLRANKDEILLIENKLKAAKDRLIALQANQSKQKETLDFLSSNKEQFKQIRTDIRNLSLEDRKILVEAMLYEPVVVDYQEDNEIDGPGGVSTTFWTGINIEILKRFVDEGKIKLDKNSPQYSSTTQLE